MGIRHRPVRSACLAAVLAMAAFAASAASADGVLVSSDGFERCCRIGGSVLGLTAEGLLLRLDAAGTTEDLAVAPAAGTRAYRFRATVASGSGYLVSVLQQPEGQACSIVRASGVVAGPVLDSVVQCTAAGGLLWDAGNWDLADWN